MRIGINYDTGIFPGGRESRPVFRQEQIAFDMAVIARDLRCTAVRITGGDLERLTLAADCAADAGLEVWFSPFPCEMDPSEMLTFFEESAARAEVLRQRSQNKVVLVTGCEVSVFGGGFLPGTDAYTRMSQLTNPNPGLITDYPKTLARLNAFLAAAAATSRRKFAGPVTYASGLWEEIDWVPFDLVSVDAYRDRENAAQLEHQLEALSVHGKPVVVTEFGCCTYRGAADRGASGWMILKGDGQDRQISGEYVRDEGEQVRYLRELRQIYERRGIDTAFWFTFASWNRLHDQDPHRDLDLASFGVVKIMDLDASVPRNCWKQKAVFSEFPR
jgi:hypothetical protein